MQSRGSVKHFLFAFLLALLLYGAAFSFIEGCRHRNEPWKVVFSSSSNSFPSLTINQTNLHISGVKIVFQQSLKITTNETIRFDSDRQTPFEVPFGECEFQGILTQPGTIVFKMFGHEIQLMPRVLTIDKREQPWVSGETISLPPQ